MKVMKNDSSVALAKTGFMFASCCCYSQKFAVLSPWERGSTRSSSGTKVSPRVKHTPFLWSTRWPHTTEHHSVQVSLCAWESVLLSYLFKVAKPSSALIPATQGPPLWESILPGFSRCCHRPLPVRFAARFHTCTGVLIHQHPHTESGLQLRVGAHIQVDRRMDSAYPSIPL